MLGRKNRFRRAKDLDFDREVSFHIDEVTQANIAKGMNPSEARRQALVEFGGAEQVKQQIREVHSSAMWMAVGFNLKSAWRFARRSPSFSVVIILILALAIGANSAVFSAIDAVVLRPLSFPQADQLILVTQQDVKNRDANHFVAPVRVEDWNRMNSTFQSLSGYYLDDLSEISGTLPEKLTQAMVAPRFLRVMGVSPILGRDFTPEEEHWGGSPAVLISYRYWQRRFHGDVTALNQKVRFGEFSCSIVGVMPANFAFPNRDVDVWEPSAPDAPFALRRDATWFTVIGRLKIRSDPVRSERRSGDSASATRHAISKDRSRPFRPNDAAQRNRGWRHSRFALAALWIGVAAFAHCMFEYRGAAAGAHGRSRARDFSPLFVRSVAVGDSCPATHRGARFGNCRFAIRPAGRRRRDPCISPAFQQLPRAEEITLNWRIVAYSLACALTVTVLCGLIPAIRGTRRQLASHSGADQPNASLEAQSSAVDPCSGADHAGGDVAQRSGIIATQFERVEPSISRLRPEPCSDVPDHGVLGRNFQYEGPASAHRSYARWFA